MSVTRALDHRDTFQQLPPSTSRPSREIPTDPTSKPNRMENPKRRSRRIKQKHKNRHRNMNTKSRMIPAGMILRSNDYFIDNSNKSGRDNPPKNAAPKPNNSVSTNHTDKEHSTSTPKGMSPPKTICKKKRPLLDDLQVSYNQNCIFNADANQVRKQLPTRSNENFNACKTSTSQNIESGDCEENWNIPSTSASKMHNQNTDRYKEQLPTRSNRHFNACKATSQSNESGDCDEDWNLSSTSSSEMHNQNTDRCRKQLSTRSNGHLKACKTTSQNIESGDHVINWDLPSTSSSQMHNQTTDRRSRYLSTRSIENFNTCKTTSQNIESGNHKRNRNLPLTLSSQMHNRSTDRCTVNRNTTDGTDTDSSVEANSFKKTPTSSVKNDPIQLLDEKSQRLNLDSDITFEAWCIGNIKFEESNTRLKNTPLLKSATHSKLISTTTKKIYNSDIVIHGLTVPKPIKSVQQAHFSEDVEKTMITLKHTTPTPIQTYMWPTIQKWHNAFVVASPGTGKTFSYLPAICTFVLQKKERYQELAKYQGPLIIILCPDDAKCQDIKTMVNFINEDGWGPTVTSVLHGNSNKTNFDILITTPSKLKENLKTEAVKLERVCHVVLEDAHILLKEHHEFMSTFFKILNHIQITRPHNGNIQIIVCSEKWSKDLHVLMGNLHIPPVMCFQDFLEAALYANVHNDRKVLKASDKIFFLIDILRPQYSTHRTIVFCNSDEINSVYERLQQDGIECISLSGDLIEDDIFENEDMWSYLTSGRFKVLLCPDSLLDNTLEISNAEWIVHYSPPANWKVLQKRYRCLVKNLHCPLDEDLDQKKNMQSKFIAETEECNNIFGDYHNVLLRNLVKKFTL